MPSPLNYVHDDIVKDTNEIPNDLEHTSPKPYIPLLPFHERMSKAKLGLQFRKF